MSSALQEKRSVAKKHLAKKVLPRARHKGSGGLVSEFARLWQAYEKGEPGAFKALHSFVDTIKLSLDEIQFYTEHDAKERAEAVLFEMNNQGYGKAIRARNVLNQREGADTHWHDGGNGAPPPEERLGLEPQ